MKRYKIQFDYSYEGYNGYDHNDSATYEVEARNSVSAVKKAKKLFDKNKGCYCTIRSTNCSGCKKEI